jgi:hypothetical protein
MMRTFKEATMIRTLTASSWKMITSALLVAAIVGGASRAMRAASTDGSDDRDNTSVAARLGGFPGILAFLDRFVVPAEVADPVVGPFFVPNIKEPAGDIEQCLAMLLDHDLGGSSPHFGAILADGHQCRSSMSNIHRGFGIPDFVIDRFIAIVGEQAAMVGVADSDIQEVAKVLDSYRGGVRNK